MVEHANLICLSIGLVYSLFRYGPFFEDVNYMGFNPYGVAAWSIYVSFSTLKYFVIAKIIWFVFCL